jgi:hypothetical protein
VAESFDDYPYVRHRALQIWQILISKAHNRQTVTYGILAEMLGFEGAGTMHDMLGHIGAYCALHDLPLLNTIVVGKDSGLPTDGTLGRDPNEERERVFRHQWFKIYPPRADALAEAFAEANRRGWVLD